MLSKMKTLNRKETISALNQIKISKCDPKEGLKIFYIIKTRDDLEKHRCKAYKIIIP